MQEDNTSKVAWFFAGAAIGASIALLFAPALIWRVTGVEVMPFDAISERQLAIESPALRELEAWRQVHMTAWAPQLAGKTRAEIGRMPVVVQRFVVIHPRGPAPAR